MDSDDFRALLISTGYSLVCSLRLPRCCAAPPRLPFLSLLPSCPPPASPVPPPFSPSSSSCHSPPEFPGPRGHPSTKQCSPSSLLLLHLLGWGPSDDSLSLPLLFLEVSGERRSVLRLPLSFLFLSFSLPHPPELTCEPRAEEQQTCLIYTPLPTFQKQGRGRAEGARPQFGAHGAHGAVSPGSQDPWRQARDTACMMGSGPALQAWFCPLCPATLPHSKAACPLPCSCLTGRR